MSHTIYHTEAFVMKTRSSGEADKTFDLFTKDFGRISAKATGIRKIGSRLRYFVQDLRYVDVSLVKGKTYWRLVSARPIHELNSKKSLSTPSRVRSLQLLSRLAPEGEPHPALFDDLVAAYEFTSQEKLSGAIIQSVEALLALKILHSLGYWGEQAGHDFVASPFNGEVMEKVAATKKNIIREVNKSLAATMLLS